MSTEERRPILRGERVFLRAAERDDLSTFVAWLNDAVVVETLGARGPMSSAAEESWFEQLQAEQGKTRWHFVVCLRDGGRAIGSAGLDALDSVNGKTELGIAIGEPSLWDQGYGTETIGILLDFAFGELRMERVYLYLFSANDRARHVYERVGFVREGTLRRASFRHGQHVDVDIMGILRDEWAADDRPRTWERD